MCYLAYPFPWPLCAIVHPFLSEWWRFKGIESVCATNYVGWGKGDFIMHQGRLLGLSSGSGENNLKVHNNTTNQVVQNGRKTICTCTIIVIGMAPTDKDAYFSKEQSRIRQEIVVMYKYTNTHTLTHRNTLAKTKHARKSENCLSC